MDAGKTNLKKMICCINAASWYDLFSFFFSKLIVGVILGSHASSIYRGDGSCAWFSMDTQESQASCFIESLLWSIYMLSVGQDPHFMAPWGLGHPSYVYKTASKTIPPGLVPFVASFWKQEQFLHHVWKRGLRAGSSCCGSATWTAWSEEFSYCVAHRMQQCSLGVLEKQRLLQSGKKSFAKMSARSVLGRKWSWITWN